MARILYAASGDGYGHAVRLHSVGGGLIARGHDVRFISSAKTSAYLREHFPGRVHDVFGLFTVYNQGKAEPLRTVWHNIRRALDYFVPAARNGNDFPPYQGGTEGGSEPRTEWNPDLSGVRADFQSEPQASACAMSPDSLPPLPRGGEGGSHMPGGLRQLIRAFKPNLIITDFEPFTAFWARAYGIPYISLDNQHLLTHCELDHPTGYSRDLLNAYLTIRLYYGGAQRYLIPTFYEAPIRYHPTRLIPPILRPAVYDIKPGDDGFLLAYKGAGGENDAMRKSLERFDRLPIRAYGFGISGQNKHVTFKETNGESFLHDLATCRAVISTAGHSLVCECLHFGKPMLLVPVKQQYEQVLNAHHVERLDAGRSCDKLRPELIDGFLNGLDRYRLAITSRPVASLDEVLQSVEAEIP